jgi:hypothetical protein
MQCAVWKKCGHIPEGSWLNNSFIINGTVFLFGIGVGIGIGIEKAMFSRSIPIPISMPMVSTKAARICRRQGYAGGCVINYEVVNISGGWPFFKSNLSGTRTGADT